MFEAMSESTVCKMVDECASSLMTPHKKVRYQDLLDVGGNHDGDKLDKEDVQLKDVTWLISLGSKAKALVQNPS